MKTNKESIVLYRVIRKNDKFKLEHFGTAILNRQTLIFFINGQVGINEKEYLFNYSLDFPYKYLDFEFDNGSLKINCRLTYNDFDINKEIKENNLYCYLSFAQRIKIKYFFKNLWFQNPSNIMWLINIIIALIASLSAMFLIINNN